MTSSFTRTRLDARIDLPPRPPRGSTWLPGEASSRKGWSFARDPCTLVASISAPAPPDDFLRIPSERFRSDRRGGCAASDEVRLLQRLARRDSGAVAEAYALYGGPVFSYALRALGSREDAEEVLQDTFLRLWEKAGDYDPSLGRPFTWVFLLARGLCLDRQRRVGRRSRRVRMAATENGGDVAPFAARGFSRRMNCGASSPPWPPCLRSIAGPSRWPSFSNTPDRKSPTTRASRSAP